MAVLVTCRQIHSPEEGAEDAPVLLADAQVVKPSELLSQQFPGWTSKAAGGSLTIQILKPGLVIMPQGSMCHSWRPVGRGLPGWGSAAHVLGEQ